MLYHEIHSKMKAAFDATTQNAVYPELGVSIHKKTFKSIGAHGILHGSDMLSCAEHQLDFQKFNSNDKVSDHHSLDVPDYFIQENLSYTISLIKPDDVDVVDDLVILFHGLNEKKWDKYLPWAHELATRSKRGVLLYPISFHMDRAPEQWSDRKLMFQIAQIRATDLFENSDSSYVNAAISSRMETQPQRMFWSGLQSYHDIIEIVNSIKAGQFNLIKPEATINLFGYSIGSFLSIILMMSNPNNIFSNSKLFCFCGGMTIDRMFPISKYIMDARAAIAMQKVFAQLLTTNFSSDSRLGHYQNPSMHPEESWFKTMLRYNHFQAEREERFKDLEGRIKALVLEQDEVAPPVESLNTLKGARRSIAIEVEVKDFDFPYTHMVPFPLTTKNGEQVHQAFTQTMQSALTFYNS
ncbi:DUF6051 family protein [Flavobacterium agricola]|uniref:DUF6051 family protein n=1 Tax=Flavobacterium agricola TaxID=2870839 RepID=A0ABY6LYF8_9FLAO|nr:DUF6051 family protein [Flavobacterium agricola]UYW01368.1 DUF6051 family protein [Flavobacterium agricola]